MEKVEPFSHAAIVAGFHSQAFATVPCLLEPHIIPEAIEHFFAFLALPQHVKESISYKHRTDRRGGRAGYKNSDPEPPHDPDGKEVFQFHASIRLRFERERARIPELDRLMRSSEQLYTAGSAIIHKIVSGFERECPGITEAFFPANDHPFFHLRFLRYKRAPQNNGACMAIGHYDIGSLTVAFAESAPGLRIGGDHPSPMTEVVHQEGTALVMPSWNFPKDISLHGIVPAWHDVVQQPERAHSETTSRWAIVMFADSITQHSSPTWEQTHTRRGTVPHEQLALLA